MIIYIKQALTDLANLLRHDVPSRSHVENIPYQHGATNCYRLSARHCRLTELNDKRAKFP